MIVNRHRLFLEKMGLNFQDFSLENVKVIGVFFTTFIITAFFGYQMISAINKGIETRSRTEVVSRQVKSLEEQNAKLILERDRAKSDTEVESQLRALGYKRPGDKVFIVTDEATPTPEISPDNEIESSKVADEPPWVQWSNILFKKI